MAVETPPPPGSARMGTARRRKKGRPWLSASGGRFAARAFAAAATFSWLSSAVVRAQIVTEWPTDIGEAMTPLTAFAASARYTHDADKPGTLPERAIDGNVNINTDNGAFQPTDEGWGMYYSGKTDEPWLQVDLGALKAVRGIELHGHRVAQVCNFHLLYNIEEPVAEEESSSSNGNGNGNSNGNGNGNSNSAANPTTYCIDGPKNKLTFDEFGVGALDPGLVLGTAVGVRETACPSDAPCIPEVVCGTVEALDENTPVEDPIRILCPDGTTGQYIVVHAKGAGRELFVGELKAALADPPAQTCDASAPPANGAVGDCTSELAAGSTCQPTCAEGTHTVSGPSTCSAEGDLVPATCLCDASAAPANGAVGDCTDKLAPGSTCQPECNSGFEASGATSCGSDGTMVPATCLAAVGDPCDASTPPANGDVGDCTDELASGSTCQPPANVGDCTSTRRVHRLRRVGVFGRELGRGDVRAETVRRVDAARERRGRRLHVYARVRV